MKHILYLLLLSPIFLLPSCEKDQDNSEINNQNNQGLTQDNYYVNYIISAPGPYGRFSNWTATTPDGSYSNSGLQVTGWNQTYGPVSKYFMCNVEIGHFQGGTPTIEIHVAKNQEPFALKASSTGSSASYVINY